MTYKSYYWRAMNNMTRLLKDNDYGEGKKKRKRQPRQPRPRHIPKIINETQQETPNYIDVKCTVCGENMTKSGGVVPGNPPIQWYLCPECKARRCAPISA